MVEQSSKPKGPENYDYVPELIGRSFPIGGIVLGPEKDGEIVRLEKGVKSAYQEAAEALTERINKEVPGTLSGFGELKPITVTDETPTPPRISGSGGRLVDTRTLSK